MGYLDGYHTDSRLKNMGYSREERGSALGVAAAGGDPFDVAAALGISPHRPEAREIAAGQVPSFGTVMGSLLEMNRKGGRFL